MLPTMTCLTCGVGDHLLHGGGKVLQHDHGFRAGILQLVLELARRVERIDVDHRIAGAQHGRGRDRILQHVRHHQRDAGALLQALALQEGGQGQRHLVEVAVADRLVHADEGLAIGKFRKALLQQLDERRVLRHVDIGGHASRILLEPDPLHGNSPPVHLPLIAAACLAGTADFGAILGNQAARGKRPGTSHALRRIAAGQIRFKYEVGVLAGGLVLAAGILGCGFGGRLGGRFRLGRLGGGGRWIWARRPAWHWRA